MSKTIFVYGTLKAGRGNHGLLRGAKFLGEGKTTSRHQMTASGIPFVHEFPKETEIHGELYEVDDATLSRLDSLEGHPNWYERKPVEVKIGEKKYKTELYFNNNSRGTKIIENGKY